jgi:hypothetical protein
LDTKARLYLQYYIMEGEEGMCLAWTTTIN